MSLGDSYTEMKHLHCKERIQVMGMQIKAYPLATLVYNLL